MFLRRCQWKNLIFAWTDGEFREKRNFKACKSEKHRNIQVCGRKDVLQGTKGGKNARPCVWSASVPRETFLGRMCRCSPWNASARCEMPQMFHVKHLAVPRWMVCLLCEKQFILLQRVGRMFHVKHSGESRLHEWWRSCLPPIDPNATASPAIWLRLSFRKMWGWSEAVPSAQFEHIFG